MASWEERLSSLEKADTIGMVKKAALEVEANEVKLKVTRLEASRWPLCFV